MLVMVMILTGALFGPLLKIWAGPDAVDVYEEDLALVESFFFEHGFEPTRESALTINGARVSRSFRAQSCPNTLTVIPARGDGARTSLVDYMRARHGLDIVVIDRNGSRSAIVAAVDLMATISGFGQLPAFGRGGSARFSLYVLTNQPCPELLALPWADLWNTPNGISSNEHF
jgi:hypothetical protein